MRPGPSWQLGSRPAYAEYYRATGNERLTTEVLGLMTRLEQVAQARYAGGLAAQADAIRAQLEQTAMRSELIMIDSEKRQIRAKLNAPAGSRKRRTAGRPPGAAPDTDTEHRRCPSLAERARSGNPQIQAELARVALAQKSRDLTQRNRYPDLTVGVSPSQMGSRITTWGVMLEMNIPLQQEARRGQEREAEAMVAASRSSAEALSAATGGRPGRQSGRARGRAAHRDAAEDPAAAAVRTRPAFGLAAYENGKAEFAMLLEAQRQIRKARQEILKTQVEAQMRLADIERIVGEDL
jgi:cobalt-zinc-cadmium efflux system outer membrane protein